MSNQPQPEPEYITENYWVKVPPMKLLSKMVGKFSGDWFLKDFKFTKTYTSDSVMYQLTVRWEKHVVEKYLKVVGYQHYKMYEDMSAWIRFLWWAYRVCFATRWEE